MLGRFIRANWKWLICVIALLIFFLIFKAVNENDVLGIDQSIADFVLSIRSNLLTLFFKFITMLCDVFFIAFIILFIMFFVKDFRFKKYLCANILIIVATNNVIKFIVSRDRPLGEHLVHATGFSFPSGHSMTAMAMYGLFICFAYKYMKNDVKKHIVIISLSMLIVLIGISRIYLGVHHTSDVLAGFSISLAYLIVYVHLMESRLVKKMKMAGKIEKIVEEN